MSIINYTEKSVTHQLHYHLSYVSSTNNNSTLPNASEVAPQSVSATSQPTLL